jgi:rubrerythrin
MPPHSPADPARRAFLTRAPAAAAGAALLAAGCGAKDKDKDKAAAPAASCEPTDADKQADAKLITAAILLEEEAVKVYTAAAGLPFIASDAVVLSTAARFMEQHKDHSTKLQALLKALGAPPADLNAVKVRDLPAAITDASLPDADRKRATLQFARDFEMSAAQTYFQFTTAQLRTPAARKLAADIMPAEAQHVAIYDMVLGAEKPSAAGFLSEQS